VAGFKPDWALFGENLWAHINFLTLLYSLQKFITNSALQLCAVLLGTEFYFIWDTAFWIRKPYIWVRECSDGSSEHL